MISFSTQCKQLRDSYLSQNESNMDVKLKFISKILSLTYFISSDGLPLNTPLNIFCGDICCDRQTMTASLVEVINDLNYDNCDVRSDIFPSANMLTVTVA